MKVFIITEGSKDIGFGHITRCISLYQAFKERGIMPEFIVNGDDNIKDLLKERNHQIFNWLKEKDKLFELVNNADIVIIDSYLADKSLYDKIAEVLHNRPLVMIDDYNRIEYPIGIIVNPSIYGDKVSYLQKDEMLYLLGKDYVILQKEFWSVPEKKINKKVKNILTTFGGINHSDLVHKVVNYLRKKFDFNFYIVEPSKNRLDPKEMLNLMLKADICISGGGQTIYELARIGVPTIGICFAENQRWNLDDCKARGLIEYIGWRNDKKLLFRLEKSIDKLVLYKERVRRTKMARSLIDGKGAERVVNTIMHKGINLNNEKGFIKKNFNPRLRHAQEDDCYDLWIWRNHPEARKWSFNKEEIEYKRHKEWFAKKMKDRKTKIYIAENRKGDKVGQVRFETRGEDLAYININLNPRFFGKGLGNKIIKVATEVFKGANPDVKEVVAEIVDRNILSKKAFQKAGYVFSHNTFKQGKKTVVYKFKS